MARINRKAFLGGSAALGSALLSNCHIHIVDFINKDFDIVIRGGEIFDGSGNGSYSADIGIKNGRIIAIGTLIHKGGARTISARGLAVCPGFIDIHSHSDLQLFREGRAYSKIMQGVTTEILGADGRSLAPLFNSHRRHTLAYIKNVTGQKYRWYGISGMHHALQKQGVSVNFRTMLGSATLRQAMMSNHRRAPTSSELIKMKAMCSSARADGAPGISSGLEYLPGGYAKEYELVQICKGSHVYSTHMRNEDDHVLQALEEAIRIARKARCGLNISHIKAQGRPNWHRLDLMLERLRVMDRVLPFATCDRYPYIAYNTRLANLFPVHARSASPRVLADHLSTGQGRLSLRAAVERKLASLGGYNGVLLSNITSSRYRKHSGKRLGDLAAQLGRHPYQLLCDLLIASGGNGGMVGFGMDEHNLEKLMKFTNCAIASDGTALVAGEAGHTHPRSFGTFPRVLSRYVREKGILSLENAVRKMTALPARIMNIKKRGQIKVGYHADIVIFDPDQIKDRATFSKPDVYPEGIAYVLVNGKIVVDDGEHTGAMPGRIA